MNPRRRRSRVVDSDEDGHIRIEVAVFPCHHVASLSSLWRVVVVHSRSRGPYGSVSVVYISWSNLCRYSFGSFGLLVIPLVSYT